jgi:hypothetical protein
MDERRIDDMARRLATGIGRRRLVGGFAAALIGGTLLPAAASACKRAGKSCDKSKDCCDGARCKRGKCVCKGDRTKCDGGCFDLEREARHCGACGNECGAGETCRDGVCVGEEGCPAGSDSCGGPTVLCADNPDCGCVQTIGGATRCADFNSNSGICGVCDDDADCAPLGRGAFCARAAQGSNCCFLGEGDNICVLPCQTPV